MHVHTYMCVCVCMYLDIWIVIPLPPNFGEMKIFVLLGLFGHLRDVSEQECGWKVPSREVLFFLSSKLDTKVCRNGNTSG